MTSDKLQMKLQCMTLINVKNKVYKNGYRRRSCTSKTAKIHHFVRLVMYCSSLQCQ